MAQDSNFFFFDDGDDDDLPTLQHFHTVTVFIYNKKRVHYKKQQQIYFGHCDGPFQYFSLKTYKIPLT